ncbi:glycosyltransferase family 4 protein [Sulfurihydrogenibium sp.]|uniref:glycosyltransferase family 4 protein n=1 Tax=Sulfurihydrogenibium sp. TaxID=2053621 RepID=UPI002618B497|nr:glycosyltransferase family 4 protein [Sulfurihydrogenibium sp.]
MINKNICIVTTVHSPFDVRIFHKEAISLKKAGYNLTIIAPHDINETVNDINIIALKKHKDRIQRMFKTSKQAFILAVNQKADVYHFHDPELIPVGLKLKKLGKKVIYDVHEDVPRHILTKPYLNRFIKPIVSKMFEIYENYAAKKFDVIITATPYIRDRFKEINKNTVDINNYPKIDELYEPVNWDIRKNEICYIGGITKIRGIEEVIKALEYTNTTLHLAGNFESKELEEYIKSLKGWSKVRYYGFVGRDKVKEILKNVKIGLVTLYPTINYLDSLPVKMFEYMSAGIPVIASNFPLWKEIIERNNCGICVDPLNPKEIANGINYLLENDHIAKTMGENGRKLVMTKYNWENEEKKLLDIYFKILK